MDTIKKNFDLSNLSNFITNHEKHAIYKIALCLVNKDEEINMALCTRVSECLKQTNNTALHNLYLPEFEDIAQSLPTKFLNIVMSSYTTFLASISPAYLLSRALTSKEHDVCTEINFIGNDHPSQIILNAHLIFLRRLVHIVSKDEYFPAQVQKDFVLLTSLQKNIVSKASSHYIHFPIEENLVTEIYKLFIDYIWAEAITTETDIKAFSGGVLSWQSEKVIERSRLFEMNLNSLSFILQQIKNPPSSSFISGYIYAHTERDDFVGADVFIAQLKKLPKVDLPLLKASLSKALLLSKEKKHSNPARLTELMSAFELNNVDGFIL